VYYLMVLFTPYLLTLWRRKPKICITAAAGRLPAVIALEIKEAMHWRGHSKSCVPRNCTSP